MAPSAATSPVEPLAMADAHGRIRVVGARENNLKDVSVEIPKRRLFQLGQSCLGLP